MDLGETKWTDNFTTPFTVKTQIMMIPMNTAKNIQPDQAVVLKPANILATITAEIAIVYDRVQYATTESAEDTHLRLRTLFVRYQNHQPLR